MDDINDVCKILVQVSRLALNSKSEDVRVFLDRTVRTQTRKSDGSVWLVLRDLLKDTSHEFYSARNFQMDPLPSDQESKMQLLQEEKLPIVLDVEPIWENDVKRSLDQVVLEQSRKASLKKAGLPMSKTLLFSGPPGVGKTLAARWLAKQLKMPLFTLNLSSVMSSFLGKTGNNIRNVFAYASSAPCILLLDEFDAIAKKRNDDSEIGELKRLVTVLLQEIDHWNNQSILIAATNHQELLDSAVWRRFDITIDFSLPHEDSVSSAIKLYFSNDFNLISALLPALSVVMQGLSYSDIQRNILRIRKVALLGRNKLQTEVAEWMVNECKSFSHDKRCLLAIQLDRAGISQRTISRITGISRDTIRKKTKGEIK